MTHIDVVKLCDPKSMFEAHRWDALGRILSGVNLHAGRPGCIVHMGVGSGGALGYFALRYPDRRVYGYCAFDRGLVGCGPRDAELKDGDCASPNRDAVASWIESIGAKNAVLVDCDVRSELPSEHEQCVMAVIDLNIYEPTLAALRWLKIHSLPGAIVIIDDWNWSGVKAAIDEYGSDCRQHGYLGVVII